MTPLHAAVVLLVWLMQGRSSVASSGAASASPTATVSASASSIAPPAAASAGFWTTGAIALITVLAVVFLVFIIAVLWLAWRWVHTTRTEAETVLVVHHLATPATSRNDATAGNKPADSAASSAQSHQPDKGEVGLAVVDANPVHSEGPTEQPVQRLEEHEDSVNSAPPDAPDAARYREPSDRIDLYKSSLGIPQVVGGSRSRALSWRRLNEGVQRYYADASPSFRTRRSRLPLVQEHAAAEADLPAEPGQSSSHTESGELRREGYTRGDLPSRRQPVTPRKSPSRKLSVDTGGRSSHRTSREWAPAYSAGGVMPVDSSPMSVERWVAEEIAALERRCLQLRHLVSDNSPATEPALRDSEHDLGEEQRWRREVQQWRVDGGEADPRASIDGDGEGLQLHSARPVVEQQDDQPPLEPSSLRAGEAGRPHELLPPGDAGPEYSAFPPELRPAAGADRPGESVGDAVQQALREMTVLQYRLRFLRAQAERAGAGATPQIAAPVNSEAGAVSSRVEQPELPTDPGPMTDRAASALASSPRSASAAAPSPTTFALNVVDVALPEAVSGGVVSGGAYSPPGAPALSFRARFDTAAAAESAAKWTVQEALEHQLLLTLRLVQLESEREASKRAASAAPPVESPAAPQDAAGSHAPPASPPALVAQPSPPPSSRRVVFAQDSTAGAPVSHFALPSSSLTSPYAPSATTPGQSSSSRRPLGAAGAELARGAPPPSARDAATTPGRSQPSTAAAVAGLPSARTRAAIDWNAVGRRAQHDADWAPPIESGRHLDRDESAILQRDAWKRSFSARLTETLQGGGSAGRA